MSETHVNTILDAGKLLRLNEAEGTRITCIEGWVWITMDGDSRDMVLRAGEHFVIDRPGMTLVSGMRRSVLVLREPAAIEPAHRAPDARPARAIASAFDDVGYEAAGGRRYRLVRDALGVLRLRVGVGGGWRDASEFDVVEDAIARARRLRSEAIAAAMHRAFAWVRGLFDRRPRRGAARARPIIARAAG